MNVCKQCGRFAAYSAHFCSSECSMLHQVTTTPIGFGKEENPTTTIGELKLMIKDLPDDAEVWREDDQYIDKAVSKLVYNVSERKLVFK